MRLLSSIFQPLVTVAEVDEVGYLAAMTRLEIGIPLIASCVLAYLIGSVNLVILASRMLRKEEMLRTGSGNPGVTNLFRAIGPKVAVPVLAAELSKSFFTIWILKVTFLGSMASLCVVPFVLGNLYPLFHQFKGGKGVAATVGTFLAINPIAMLLGGGMFIIAFATTRRVSVGSLAMVCTYPFWSTVMDAGRPNVIVSFIMSLIIVFTHRSNIRRLMRGTEPKLRVGRKGNYDDNA